MAKENVRSGRKWLGGKHDEGETSFYHWSAEWSSRSDGYDWVSVDFTLGGCGSRSVTLELGYHNKKKYLKKIKRVRKLIHALKDVEKAMMEAAEDKL